jgi:hypothetical protein
MKKKVTRSALNFQLRIKPLKKSLDFHLIGIRGAHWTLSRVACGPLDDCSKSYIWLTSKIKFCKIAIGLPKNASFQ